MVIVDRLNTCVVVKKRSGMVNEKAYIVGHSSNTNLEWALRASGEPLNLSTRFNSTLSISYYCHDGYTITLNSGNVVAGLQTLPNVVETFVSGRWVRDQFIYPPGFILPGGGKATPRVSLSMLESAVDYNDRIDFDVIMVEKIDGVRLSDILSELSGLRQYQYVHALVCRSL